MFSRSRCLASVVTSLIFTSAHAGSTPITIATLNGSWELRTVCMNDHGKSGACIELKPGSLQFTFTPDGKWTSAANDVNKTKKGGTHQIEGSRLVMKNVDGSIYQQWQPDLSEDGQRFVVTDKQLIETFQRVGTTRSPLE